jgi:uncharacterized membrane-anchored protein
MHEKDLGTCIHNDNGMKGTYAKTYTMGKCAFCQLNLTTSKDQIDCSGTRGLKFESDGTNGR